jgi:hypothetical protein
MSAFKDILDGVRVTHVDGTPLKPGEVPNDCGYCNGGAERQPPQVDCPVCRGTGVHPTKALALVASDGDGHGAVLEHNGALYYDLEENGIKDLEELGLGEAPDGLSVFEGRYTGGGYNSYNGDYDDVYLGGTFRELTRADWDAIIEKKRLF